MNFDPWFTQSQELIEFDLQLAVLEKKLRDQSKKNLKIELFPLSTYQFKPWLNGKKASMNKLTSQIGMMMKLLMKQ